MDTMSYLLGKNASGGGGSTGSDIFVVKGTYNGGTYILDKTYQEILEAYQGNKLLILDLPEYTLFLKGRYDYTMEEPEIVFDAHAIIAAYNTLYSDTLNISRLNGLTVTTEEYALTQAS